MELALIVISPKIFSLEISIFPLLELYVYFVVSNISSPTFTVIDFGSLYPGIASNCAIKSFSFDTI